MLRSTLVVSALLLPSLALADGIERRLHPERVDASSFLWNDWNKFQENYHPLYVGDDDAKTAWVEGAEGSGAGEWIRVAVTDLDGTSRVRLHLRNGYQKSKGLFKANARLKQVKVRLLPGKAEKAFTLADADGWQDLVVDQALGHFDAVELKVVSVYEGSRYEDLCLSDLQIFATSTTKENPAFEKSKLQKLLAWKVVRVQAAKTFQSAAGKEPLPILPAYRWEAREDDLVAAAAERCKKSKNQRCWPDEIHTILLRKAPALAEKHKVAIAQALDGLHSEEGFVPAQLAPKGDQVLPAADGLHVPSVEDRYEGVVGYAGLELPVLDTVAGLRVERLSAFEIKSSVDVVDVTTATAPACRRDSGKLYAWMRKEKTADGRDRVRAMRFAKCSRFETRDGEESAGLEQVAVYDAQGRLEVLVGEGYVNVFTWKDATLVGGLGIFNDGRIGELSGPEVAKAP